MLKHLLAALAVAIGVVTIVFATQTKHASAQAPESSEVAPSTAQVVHTALMDAAERYGQSAPTAIEEASSSLGTAARVTDPNGTPPAFTDPSTGKPWTESPVDVVTMRGNFTYSGPAPSNLPAPTGTVLTIMIDPKSGVVVSETLGHSQLDMHAINSSHVTQWEAQ